MGILDTFGEMSFDSARDLGIAGEGMALPLDPVNQGDSLSQGGGLTEKQGIFLQG